MSWMIIAIIALVHTIFFLNNPICSWNAEAIFHLVKGDYSAKCTTDIGTFTRCSRTAEILSHKGGFRASFSASLPKGSLTSGSFAQGNSPQSRPRMSNSPAPNATDIFASLCHFLQLLYKSLMGHCMCSFKHAPN